MLNFRIGLAVLLLMPGFACTDPNANGNDDHAREDIAADGSVGRIVMNGSSGCSAVLIQADIALTAGHCVATGGSAWQAPPVIGLTFVVQDTVYPIRQVALSPQSPYSADGTRIQHFEHDWAILSLVAPGASADDAPKPVPFGGTSTARLAFTIDEPLTKLGYEDAILRRSNECGIEELSPTKGVLIFRCGQDWGPGRSGSALVFKKNSGNEVIAIQSAIVQHSTNRIGIAVIPPADLLENHID